MIDDNSNTALDATTLSNNYYRWLASGDWSSSEMIFFAEQRGREASQVFKGPNFYKKTQAPHLHRVARWTLNHSQNETDLIGWAELQHIGSSFNLGLLLTSIDPKIQDDEALALCLGASLILGEFDQLRLISARPLSKEALGWGEVKKLLTPHVDPTLLPEQIPSLIEIQAVDITPNEWWRTKSGEKTQRELNYLRSRLKRAKRDTRCC